MSLNNMIKQNNYMHLAISCLLGKMQFAYMATSGMMGAAIMVGGIIGAAI